jgi:hypothetical protein
MVEFDEFGEYSFKVRNIHIGKLKVDANRTIVSPYDFFDQNETQAQRAILLLHAFDKSENITDEEVLLTLSTYIPEAESFESLFETIELNSTYADINISDVNISSEANSTDINATDGNVTAELISQYEILSYSTNENNITGAKEHNITINFTEHNITRDGVEVNLEVPIKESYGSLNQVMNFVDIVNDKNVTINNFEEKYLVTKTSLISFNLGDRYVVNTIVKKDHVVLEFFDNTSRITDEAILITSEDEDVLSTNLLDIYLVRDNQD